VIDLILLVKLTALLSAGFVVSFALRRRAAAARHFGWTLTLSAAVVLGPASAVMPAFPLRVPALPFVLQPPIAAAVPINTGAPSPSLSVEGTPVSAPSMSAPDRAPVARFSVDQVGATVWLVGVALLLCWNALGHLGLARLARRASTVTDPEWRTLLAAASVRSGVRRSVRLARSNEVGMPITWGAVHPVVLLPTDCDAWSPDRRRVVLLHELAHVARLDYATQLGASIACALYWFHPLAWLAARRLRNDSERACDDRVLQTGTPAADYAAHLLNVARGARALRLTAAFAIGMARRSALEGRMLAVLDDTQVRGSLSRRACSAALAVLAVALIPLAGVRPVAAAETPAGREPATLIDTRSVPTTAPSKDQRARPEQTRAQPDSVIERILPASAKGVLRLELETGGTVDVRGWDQPRVRVVARLRGRNWRDEEFSADADRGNIVVRSWFSARGGRNTSTSNEFEISVPRQFDVQLNSGGGALTITNVDGTFRGHTGGGDLVLQHVTGDARLTTGGGDVTVADATLDGTVSTGGGMVQISRVQGSIRGSSGSGPVIYAERSGALHVEKAGGDITLGEVTDGAVVTTGGGRVRIGRTAGLVRASTGGGDISIGPITGSLRAGTGAGNVDLVVADSRGATQDIDVHSGTGRVTLELPRNFSGVVEIETAYTRSFRREARITSEWDLERDPVTDWDDRDGTPRRYVRAHATLGTGGRGYIRVKTVNGDVELRRGRE